MAIILQSDKGGLLTAAEADNNIKELRDGINLQIPKESDKGIKIDSLGTPDFGWHDCHGFMLQNGDDPNRPTIVNLIGGIMCCQFSENNQIMYRFHLPHDYKLGTDIFIHVHWSHKSDVVTGGSVTWGFETTYAKGHNQESLHTPVTITVNEAVNPVKHTHQVSEGAASVSGGSAGQLDTDDLEPDGMILCRLFLDSNDITTSDASIVNPMAYFVDIHYQSTGVPTKNRLPNFYGA